MPIRKVFRQRNSVGLMSQRHDSASQRIILLGVYRDQSVQFNRWSMMSSRLTPDIALAELADHPGSFKTLFEHGSMQVEIYQPDKVDLQTPHTRDELYVVISGTGWFMNGEDRHRFVPGQVLFVPAGVEHRFVDFTDDFATWVFFYGPEGGEAQK